MKALGPVSNILQHASHQPLIFNACRAKSLPIFPPPVLSVSRFTQQQQQRRNFLSGFAPPSSLTPKQKLTATRILPYHDTLIYEIISDVSAYSTFLPYCHKSVVTKTSAPAAIDGKQYPEEATLTIGFNDVVSESFTSRVYCAPCRVVEAVSGDALTSLSGDEIAHHSPRPSDAAQDSSRKDTIMTSLSTRWTLRPYHSKPPPTSALHTNIAHTNHEETSGLPSQPHTEVTLAVEFTFANPVYAALSAATAPKVADKMIEAFEQRVKSVVRRDG